MLFSTKRTFLCVIAILLVLLVIVSCAEQKKPEGNKEPTPVPDEVTEDEQQQQVNKPKIPEQLNVEQGKEPSLNVYIKDEDRMQNMKFEEYVAGVTAGEIKNDWPEEAIKAQAIIARTFVLQFIDEKGHSKYEDAQVSTDIEEAQAWDASAVNDRIKNAVNETRGQVISYKGKFVHAWFHSNAGGITAKADEGLNYKDGNPAYIQNVKSPDDSSEIPDDEKNWTASFTKDKVIMALKDIGKSVEDFTKVSLGEKGPSGRTIFIMFDDTEASAPELRIALGSTEMKSTLLDEVILEGDKVTFKGRGYGHGVGMSQWGAYSLAQQGKSAEKIINYYFKDVDIVKMWD